MTNAAVIAVKGTTRAKSRLRGALSSELRTLLVQVMLNRVLAAAHGAAEISEVLVVASAPCDLGTPAKLLLDGGQGLNAAYALGASVTASRGHSVVLLLPADLPLVTSEDLDALITASDLGGAAIAPDRRGTGTNALYLPLPLSFSLAFGKHSALRHAALCRANGLALTTVINPALALDVDDPADLHCIAAEPRYGFLARHPRWVA